MHVDVLVSRGGHHSACSVILSHHRSGARLADESLGHFPLQSLLSTGVAGLHGHTWLF